MVMQAQPVPGQDLTADFDADWQKAQQRYQNYYNQAYTTEQNNFIKAIGENVRRKGGSDSEVAAALAEAKQQVESDKNKEADSLYLAPIRQKWKIIQSAPETFSSKSKREQIGQDFESAQESAVKNLSRDESVESSVASRIAPLSQKWSLAAEFPSDAMVPRTPAQVTAWFARNPAMQSEEKEALTQIGQGMPETDVIMAHPTLLQNAPYSSRWNPRMTSAIGREQRAEEKATAAAKKPVDITKLAHQRQFLSDQLKYGPDLPDEIKSSYTDEISNLDNVISPFRNGGNVRFSPPADESPDAGAVQEPVPEATAAPAAAGASQPIPYKKGLKVTKGQAYSIGGDTYVWNGSQFVAK